MKKILCTIAYLAASLAFADVTLPIVGHPELVDKKLWKTGPFRPRLNRRKIPSELLTTATLPTPSKAYQAPYTNIFLQDERMVVCLDSCKAAQNIQPTASGSSFTITGDGDGRASIVRQTNAYYYISKLFDRMETLGFKPTKRLIVYVDRNAPDVGSGENSSNNAFFNDADWTLSFLPASFSLLTSVSTKTSFSYSADDSSVIMHETTHSVFQALIGPILNAEIYGLHEAFADYFSMSIGGDPKIGKIMGEGVPLRSGETLLTYKTGMEAHQLGNVVMAGLWNIRLLFPDPIVADRIALETVRRVSKNLYASAGDVVAAHGEAMDEAVKANPSLAGIAAQVAAIWKQTALVPTAVKPDASAIETRASTASPMFGAEINTILPDVFVQDYGYPKESKYRIKLYEKKDTANSNQSWYHVSTVANEEGANDHWIYFDKKASGIFGAFASDRTPIDQDSGLAFKALLNTSGALSSYLSVIAGTYADAAKPFFEPSKSEKLKLIFKVGAMSVGRETVLINGIPTDTEKRTVDVTPSDLANALKIFDASDVAMITGGVKRVELLTLEPGKFGSGAVKLAKTSDGKDIVGYRLTSGSGVVNELIFTDLQ